MLFHGAGSLLSHSDFDPGLARLPSQKQWSVSEAFSHPFRSEMIAGRSEILIRTTSATKALTSACSPLVQCSRTLPVRRYPLLSYLQSRRLVSSLPSTPIFQALSKHDPNSAVVVHSASQRSFTYRNLLNDVAAAKEKLTKFHGGVTSGGRSSLAGERIAFLAENSYDYVGRLRCEVIEV